MYSITPANGNHVLSIIVVIVVSKLNAKFKVKHKVKVKVTVNTCCLVLSLPLVKFKVHR